MCGLTGLFAFSSEETFRLKKTAAANNRLVCRGPDSGGEFVNGVVALAHRRLAIINTSAAASQPMWDATGRYAIIFNGEIFNYRDLSQRFLGVAVPSGDTEVLLRLLIQEGTECLQHLHGFFSFAFWDNERKALLLARDRFGKKPLLYYKDSGFFAFASEMKALLEWDIPRRINYSALAQYLQLNYIPQPSSIIEGVHKLPPGHFMVLDSDGGLRMEMYYDAAATLLGPTTSLSYEEAQGELVRRLDESVQERLIADVPLGAFLSGGIDSSVVVGLASRHTQRLATFSIGYADQPYFDETHYARLVAQKFGTEHTVFSLRDKDLGEHIFSILNYLDEPFADSSAIPLYILCNHVRKYATVALSGDGGDEIFAGYNKHKAELRARNSGMIGRVAATALPLLRQLPRSRRNRLTNLFRQAYRYAHGFSMDVRERYWLWASTLPERNAMSLLSEDVARAVRQSSYDADKAALLQHLDGGSGMEDLLLTDVGMVLLSDMLVKVDLMSMANSLEVRSPFLAHRVVEFAFSLPTDYKMGGGLGKRIVQDAFRSMLPPELYNRPKRGFEIPLLDFLRTEFKELINNELLRPDFISAQGIFNAKAVDQYRKKLFSHNPEDISIPMWNLVVFQHWYKRYIGSPTS